MGLENRINTAIFFNILIYCCFFGMGMLENILNTTFPHFSYIVMGIVFFVGVPVTYMIALVGYISKKKRDIFQLVVLILLLLVNSFFILFALISSQIGRFIT